MSSFLRYILGESDSNLPCLPQHSSNGASRTAALGETRTLYRFDYTHVSPLAMVESVPLHDEFSLGWLLSLAEHVMTGLSNLAEVEINSACRDTHLYKLNQFKLHLNVGITGVSSLKDMVHDSLRFDLPVNELVERPMELEDYADLFQSIGLPPVARDYQQDSVFAAMRVAGPNPVMLKKMTAADDRFPVRDEHLHTVCPNDSLEAAMAEHRLYLADYAALDGVECGMFPHGQKYLYAPLALFVLDSKSRQLHPVAIQCQQRPASNNPIFTCQDGYNWLIAKTIVEIADGNFHEAVTHLGRTHLLMEPFIVSTFRQLPVQHPLFSLLAPHFQGTLAINRAAWQQLIADRGAVDKLLGGTIQESRRLAVEGVQSATHHDISLPRSFAQRGVDDTSLFPNYPFRDDAMLYWNSIHSWVSDYVSIYYSDDADVAADSELQAWFRELLSREGGRVRCLSTNDLGRKSYLIELLTAILHTCSVQHAAVNFPQFDLMSYVPNMPLASYRPAPTSKQEATEQDYLDMLPPMDLATLQTHLGYLLGTVRYTTLGQYEPGHFLDPRVTAPLKRFRRSLADNGSHIRESNRSRRSYDFLLPEGIPQSINV